MLRCAVGDGVGDGDGRSLLGRQGQIGGTRLEGGAGQGLLDLFNLLLLLLLRLVLLVLRLPRDGAAAVAAAAPALE